MAGPLIETFNATLRRLSGIEKEIAAVDAQRVQLTQERTLLLADIARAREVLSHLGGPLGVPVDHQLQSAQVFLRPRRRPIHEASSVGWARRVLRQARRPLHIDEILSLADRMSGQRINKATLVSNLSRYVKAHDTFARSAPNTYALLDDGTEATEMRLIG